MERLPKAEEGIAQFPSASTIPPSGAETGATAMSPFDTSESDWIDADERPGRGNLIDEMDRMVRHAAEADRRIAERDELINELVTEFGKCVEAYRRDWQYHPGPMIGLLAKVEAYRKEQA
jgi:hypothetical protein